MIMMGLIAGWCISRHVDTSTSARTIAGRMVQAISTDRRGMATWPFGDPGIGARIAERMTATCPTRQQVAAIQKTAAATAGGMLKRSDGGGAYCTLTPHV